MWLKVKEYARRKNFSEHSLSSASSIRESDEDTCQHQVNAFYALFCIILCHYHCLFVLEGGGGILRRIVFVSLFFSNKEPLVSESFRKECYLEININYSIIICNSLDM